MTLVDFLGEREYDQFSIIQLAVFYPDFGVSSKHQEKHQKFTYLEEAIFIQGFQGFTIE